MRSKALLGYAVTMLPLNKVLLDADGNPLNGSLGRVTGSGKAIQVEAGSKFIGDPDKALHIHVDDRAAAPAALLTGGTAYTPTKKEVAEMCPAVVCPQCGITCIGFTDAVEEFKLKDPPSTLRRYLYKSERCGCWVTQEWVAAINLELNQRQMGQQPKQIEELTPVRRKMLYEMFEKEMHKVMDEVQLAHFNDQGPLNAKLEAYVKVMSYIGEGLKTITEAEASQAALSTTENLSMRPSNVAKLAAAVKRIDAMKQAQLDKAVADVSYGYGDTGKLPDLGKAADKADAKINPNTAVGQVGQVQKILDETLKSMGIVPPSSPVTPISSRPIPSPERLEKVQLQLTSLGWEAVIGCAFKQLTKPEERLAIRDIILDSIEANRTATNKIYHPAVDKIVYYLTFGSAKADPQPTAVQGTPQPTKPVTGTRPTPATQQTLPPTITPTITPQITPEKFHEQFKRKKRRIKRLDSPEET